jgi:hypothetical protein
MNDARESQHEGWRRRRFFWMKFLFNKIRVLETHMVNNKIKIKATRLAPLFTNVSFVIPLNIKSMITHTIKLLKTCWRTREPLYNKKGWTSCNKHVNMVLVVIIWSQTPKTTASKRKSHAKQILQTFYHYKVNYFNFFFFIFGLRQPLS